MVVREDGRRLLKGWWSRTVDVVREKEGKKLTIIPLISS